MLKGKNLIVNSISMLVGRLTQAIGTFVITAAIARILGAESLGQYLLAMSYYYIFVNIASQGFKSLFTREIAREPELTPVFLINGTLLQLVISLIAYAVMVIMVFLLPYNDKTSLVCYIVGLTIVPFALSNVTEAIFQAQERMHLIVISTTPVYILRLLIMIWVMQLHYGVEYVGGILAFSELLILVIQWLLLLETVKPQWQIKKDFIWNTMKASGTFFALEGIGVINGQISVLILSLLGSEVLIGIYGAVTQLTQPFSIVANSIGLAGFPSMAKAVKLGREKQRSMTENMIEALLGFGIPFFIGSLFLGYEALLFIYEDPKFAEANLILNIIAFTTITGSFSRTFSYLLVANNYEKFNLVGVTTTTILGSLSGIIFISHYKLMGAAFMSLVMSFAYLSVVMYAVYTRLFSLDIWAVMRRPLIISAGMIIIFLFLQKLHLGFLLDMVLASCAYFFLIGLLAVKQFGSINSIYQKFFNKKLN